MERAQSAKDAEQAVGVRVLSALWGRAPSKDERLIVQGIASLFLDRLGSLDDTRVLYELDDDIDGEGSDDEEA